MAAITVNLDDSLVEFLKEFAKERNITQKKVIEESLKSMRKERMRQEAKEFFENMSPELKEECLWLANSGLEDYNRNLKAIENAND